MGQVLDEFHSGDPDKKEYEENVGAYFRKLQAEYDDSITFPRQFNLKRIPCIAHTLQLPIKSQGGEHLSDMCESGQGNGLLNIEKVFDHLEANCTNKEGQ